MGAGWPSSGKHPKKLIVRRGRDAAVVSAVLFPSSTKLEAVHIDPSIRPSHDHLEAIQVGVHRILVGCLIRLLLG
jgi:hypothetical protein